MIRARCCLLVAALASGCGGGAHRDTVPAPPECGDVPEAITGSALPRAIHACHYERVLSESSTAIAGVPSQSFGAVLVWVDGPELDELGVGITVVGVPNLDSSNLTTQATAFGATVRVDQVLGPGGEELRDDTHFLASADFDRAELTAGFLGGPMASHHLEVLALQIPGSPREPLEARRGVPLLPLAARVSVTRVRGEVVLRLPVDVETAEVTAGEPPVVIGGATVSASRDGGRMELRIENAGLRYAGHEPLVERGPELQQSCFGTLEDRDVAVRTVSCEYEVPVDRVRVAIAAEMLERRFAFDIDLGASGPPIDEP